jgi:hypothetical protein
MFLPLGYSEALLKPNPPKAKYLMRRRLIYQPIQPTKPIKPIKQFKGTLSSKVNLNRQFERPSRVS